jgi:hypothetical protein
VTKKNYMVFVLKIFLQASPVAVINQCDQCDSSLLVNVAGRADSGRTKALLAQWERKDRPNFSVATHVPNSCLEMPRVSSSFSEIPPALDIYSEVPSVSINGGVKTLGLDINSFVPVGTTPAS